MVACSDSWYRMSPGKRVVYAIAGINAAVFAMWQVPRLMPKMTKYFLHDPRTGRAYTLLTSTFSHREVWHFAFNTIALMSFGSAVADRMGAEQFTAFYLSAGVISSLANHVLSPLRPLAILPALGASGAVYAVVGATMMYFPNSQIALIFLPFLPFTISQAFPLLMAYDLAGAVLGWSTFAHWAHLGGGAFGMAYVQWGEKWWRELVKTVEARRLK
ncbi:rhomboid-domain-containing protein [Linderina pennispora]|uniref:Rhomboid-domain-containing protein n=1 Tax=Linderina pennispora TaxID=61395 RepID=A0A1Y1W2M1_9FUNG|nr:rhomboid-domain-containing protein [Linderina pennispora]ORX67779.1 rhomboid-domain-containing protein [Linderina pennispora]